jgi:voltage-gated sodium channel
MPKTPARDKKRAAAPQPSAVAGVRARLRAILLTPQWDRAITALILANAVILGLETSDSVMAAAGDVLTAIDSIIIALFVVEIALRIFAHGRDFWRDPWSVFDFSVVALTLVPATGNLSVLRALRIIRALRLVAAVDSMRRVVNGLIQAIPGMGAVVLLLSLIFYVFAVMGTNLYGETLPELFGTLGASAYSLLQVMTLEGWNTEIVNPVMEKHPYALAFFLPFMVISSFAILNLFIGIIVDSMQREAQADDAAAQKSSEESMGAILAELRTLREEVRSLRAQPSPQKPDATKPGQKPPR